MRKNRFYDPPGLFWIPQGKGCWVNWKSAEKYWIKRYNDRVWKFT